MSLPYHHELRGIARREIGCFLEPDLNHITFVNSTGVSHDADPLYSLFLNWFNPTDYQFFFIFSKEAALEILLERKKSLEERIQSEKSSKYYRFNHEIYLKMKLYEYFIKAYSSRHTKIRERKGDIVNLETTTGYNPEFFYIPPERAYDEPTRIFSGRTAGLDIMKSVLIQACDVDSLECSMPRTIQTSKLNIYERFYNYLLMDYTIQRVPKKIYDPKLERFVDYNRSEFLMPDSELRLKEEIEAIKKHVKIKDRPKFFR